MRAITMAFILGILFSISIYADEPEVKEYVNVIETESGTIKELIYKSEVSSHPQKKDVYHYDKSENLIKKIFHKWDYHKGWVATRQDDYAYNNDGLIKSVTRFTEWNNKAKNWSQAKHFVYSYNEEGELVAIKESKQEGISLSKK